MSTEGSGHEAYAFVMLNFLILGDWGRKGTPGQLAVADGMARVAEQLKSRFVVTTGDNFYDGVTSLHDAHWQESYEAVYHRPSLQIPWYVVLGNHDYQGSVQAQLDYAYLSARWCLPARYYAVEKADQRHRVRTVGVSGYLSL